MWYIFLFSFVLCVSSESKNNLTVHKNEYSDRKCYGSSNLREGQAAFIDFKVNYSLKTIENCDRLKGDGELKIKEVEKTSFNTRYLIENVTSSMNGTWKCEVLEDGVCIIVIQVMTNQLMVTVNEEPLTINWNKTDAYDGFVAYKFIENELAKIAFISKESGKMKFEQIDDGIKTGYINANEITMYIKLRNNHDGKFIDCFYQLNGETSIVRILLEQQEINPSLNQKDWKLEINRLPWEPFYRRSSYYYIEGEVLNVSCQALKGDYNTVLTGELPSQVTCPNQGYNYTLVTLNRMDTAGLKCLQSRNILYHYTDANYRLIIHYEYESNDHLNISWYVFSKTGMKNKYEVTWKDEAVMSPFEVRPEVNNHLNMTVPTIRPHNNDDRTVIKFITSIDDGFSTRQNETWIILRLKTDNNTPEESILQGDLVFYGAVGGSSILIIILLVGLCLIIRKKLKAPKNVPPEQMCGNLLSDDSSVSIPPQWNTYESDKREPSYTEINDMYAKSGPENQRTNGTYANASNSTAEEPLYSDVKRYSKSNNNFEDNKGYVNIIE